MTTYNNNIENTIYVSFHIGRGGRFNNAGHLTFTGEENFQQLLERCADQLVLINDNEEGFLPDDEWTLIDTGDNVILKGRDKIEAMTGCLDFDGEYDTDYVETVDNLGENEIEAIWKAYNYGEYMSKELEDWILEQKNI